MTVVYQVLCSVPLNSCLGLEIGSFHLVDILTHGKLSHFLHLFPLFPQLCMVSLSLFRTLLNLSCEDVLLQLVLRYLWEQS